MQKKKIQSLDELHLSQSPAVTGKKEAVEAASENKLSYEAKKEQGRKIRKLEKQVADYEAEIERLETLIAEVEEKMATPEGAADMKLYERHKELKKQAEAAENGWEAASIELEELKG